MKKVFLPSILVILTLLPIPDAIAAAKETLRSGSGSVEPCQQVSVDAEADPLAFIWALRETRLTFGRLPLCRDDASFSFTLTGIQNNTVSFERPETKVRFSYDCGGCAFIVDAVGVGAVRESSLGVVFAFKTGSSQLELICQASQCDITVQRSPSMSETQMLLRGARKIVSLSDRPSFTVSRE